jgi:hypothetical protein
MQIKGGSANTASALERALELAEQQHKTSERPQTTPAFVDVRPDDIEMRPALFQPREFAYGATEVDGQYVERLVGEIGTTGELDPILVIRLGEAWVCVDGHHRVKAYRKVKWERTIECEWFGGSVREAVNEGMRRNRTIKLEMHRADRQQQAWKRVLLGWGSKSEVVRVCGVAEGTVAHMRCVKELANADTDEGKAFRERLGVRIEESAWSLARLAYEGAERKQIGIEERAGMLARGSKAHCQKTTR